MSALFPQRRTMRAVLCLVTLSRALVPPRGQKKTLARAAAPQKDNPFEMLENVADAWRNGRGRRGS